MKEWLSALGLWRIWLYLGWLDIKGRHSRTLLGPSWTILSLIFTVTLMSLVYSILFGVDLSSYIPYVFGGFIAWYFVSTNLLESSAQFQSQRNMLLNTTFPIETVTLRMVWRNAITTLVGLPIAIIIDIVFTRSFKANIVLVVPGFLLTSAIVTAICYLIGLVGVRVRDLNIFMPTITLTLMLVTPVFWPISALGERTWVYEWNPLYHMISLIRQPILGQTVEIRSWIISAGLLVPIATAALITARSQYTSVKVLA